MELITPGIGLLFWMLLSFGIVLWILKKFAWKPILIALKDREKSIDNSMRQAEKVKEEMAQLQADNEKLLAEARKERDTIITDARKTKELIVNQAKDEASEESKKLIQTARETIESEKETAIDEIKNQVADLSVQIAEKILKEKLADKREQKNLIQKFIDEIRLN